MQTELERGREIGRYRSGRNTSREKCIERDRDGDRMNKNLNYKKNDVDSYEDRHTYKDFRLSRDDKN